MKFRTQPVDNSDVENYVAFSPAVRAGGWG